eukprot:1169204_1
MRLFEGTVNDVMIKCLCTLFPFSFIVVHVGRHLCKHRMCRVIHGCNDKSATSDAISALDRKVYTDITSVSPQCSDEIPASLIIRLFDCASELYPTVLIGHFLWRISRIFSFWRGFGA